MPSYVVVGDGVAGASAAEKLSEITGDADITVLTDESEPLYNRIQVKEFAKGNISREALQMHKREWYRENGIDLRLGTKVADVRPGEDVVVTQEGELVEYDRLLVATGGTPKKLPVENSDAEGIQEFWTLNDARAIKSRLERTDKAVIVGAGLLGMDLAAVTGSYDLEDVKYVMRGNRWWRYALDMEGSEIMHEALREIGVEPVFESGVESFNTERGKVVSVDGPNGEEWETDFVGVAIGLDYNTGMLEGTGVELENGVKVDEYMKTAEEDIYAAGELTHFYDPITGRYEQNGSWGSSKKQGEIAAKKMVEDEENSVKAEPYKWVGTYTINHFDFPFMSFGHPTIGEEYVSRKYSDTEYRRLAFRDGKLVGGVIIGDLSVQPQYKKLILEKKNVEERKEELLDEGFEADSISL